MRRKKRKDGNPAHASGNAPSGPCLDEPSQSENTNPGPSIASRLPTLVLLGYALPGYRVPGADEAGPSVPVLADFRTMKSTRQEDDHVIATIPP